LFSWKIPLYKIHTDKEDLNSISRVIKRGTDWALGKEINELEEQISKYIGSRYCVTFNSGTSALHGSLIACGIKQGDSVIVPSFTFIATPNSVLMTGAKPKFVDIEEKSLGINPDLIPSLITKNTKAIIPIHYAGLPCKIHEIQQHAKKYDLFLIEDAAEALGSKIKNKMVGRFGDMAIFSFAGNKVLTTGEGGCITTDSKKLYEKLKLIRSHGRADRQNYFSSMQKPVYTILGYNWRMSSITAALAISQLSKIEKLINLRRKNASYYSNRLKKYPFIQTPDEKSTIRNSYQLYSVRLKNNLQRDKLMKFLTKKGIMTKVFFYPVHKTPFYTKMKLNYKLSVTEKISNQILSLPMYPGLLQEELEFICDSIDEFMEQK
jgi:perosamine synthetase